MALGLVDYRLTSISIDTANDYIPQPVILSCGDNEGRIIRISVTNGGANVSADGLTARLLYNPRPQCKDSAGGYVTMTAASGTETATWTACIPGDTLVPGRAAMAFQLTDGDEAIVLTRVFAARVEGGVIHEEAHEAQSALSEFWSAVHDLSDMDEICKEALARVDAAVDDMNEKLETSIEQMTIEINNELAKADQLIDDIEGNIEEAAQAAVDEALSHYTAITWEIDPDDKGLNCIYNYEEA